MVKKKQTGDIDNERLAAAVGVHIRTFQRWLKAGCPNTSAAAVSEWRGNNIRPRGSIAPANEPLQARLLRAQAEKTEADARAKEMKNDQLAGKLYDADEVERNVAELTGMIRCRLEAIPDGLQTEIPPEFRYQLTQRWRDEIHLILTSLSQWRLSCDCPEQEPSGSPIESGDGDVPEDGTELDE